MKANPFVITIDDEADGGPMHLLHLLIDYGVGLYLNGDLVFEGIVVSTDDNVGSVPTVTLQAFLETANPSETRTFEVFGNEFDEVRYL